MGPASTGWGRQPSDRRPGTDHELNTTAKLVAVTNYLVQGDFKDELLKLINFVCKHARRKGIVIRRKPGLPAHMVGAVLSAKGSSLNKWRAGRRLPPQI